MGQTDTKGKQDDMGASSAQSILDRLTKALQSDGDFPVRAKAVSELRTLVSDPNTSVGQITQIILREPALGTRVLHVVNSAYYQRSKPIMTITQAVMQIGMRTLSDLCTGLILMTRFIPAAKRGGVFADNLKRSIITTLLATHLAASTEDHELKERSYLAGTFFNLGYLLLAYYFPQVFEAAAKRAEARGHDITQSVTEILGIKSSQLTLTIMDELDIPKFYRDVIEVSYTPLEEQDKADPNYKLARILNTADKLSGAILRFDTRQEFDEELNVIATEMKVSVEELQKQISGLPKAFADHCETVEMEFLTLPDYIENYSEEDTEETPLNLSESNSEASSINSSADSQFRQYTDEIKQAIKNREPISSIIMSVMETLAFGLKFDRVILLLADGSKTTLNGRMALGKALSEDPKSISRAIDPSIKDKQPDIAAFLDKKPQYFGDPLLKDGWPFVAIPIGKTSRTVGVIYADRLTENSNQQAILANTQAAITILSNLLDIAVGK